MYRVTKLADTSTTCSRRACLHLPRRFVSRLATIRLSLLSYRHADQGEAAAGDPQGAGAGAVLAAAAASGVGGGGVGWAHADAGLQQATERDRMGRVTSLGPGAGDAGVSPAGAATLPQGHRDSLPGSGEGVANGTRAEGRTIPRREDAGSGPAAAAGGPRRPPAPMSALRAWFWRERKREYCGPCFQSGTARSKVHRAKKAETAGRRVTRPTQI